MTTNTYSTTDMVGDADWQRLAFKFQEIYGYPPSPNNEAWKLLRDIRRHDPDWANAAESFVGVYGEMPRGDISSTQIIQQVESGQVEQGNITGAPTTTATGTVIPDGGRLIIVENPEGSDSPRLYYYALPWRGIELIYEIGDVDRFVELFGERAESTFADINVWSQGKFDSQEQFVLAGSIDQKLGQTESEASLIEREIRAAGLEDLPEWIRSNQSALLLVATATREEWSSGRLWQELSTTSGFQARYGTIIDQYTQNGAVTVGEAVRQIEADEAALGAAVRPFLAEGQFSISDDYTKFLQGLLLQGWQPAIAAQVLEQADIFRSNPEAFDQANAILEATGLPGLNQVEFLNALNGSGPAEVVEALNTAAAGRALAEAGLDDLDLDLLMEVVDTSDRLLTVDGFKSLAQELSFNMIRHGQELDLEKLGFTQEDLIASAFGEESPSGKTAGEVLNLLARFQRDRQAAGEGFDGISAFQDQRGRLRLQGLSGL